MIRKITTITVAFLAFIFIAGTASATTAVPRCPSPTYSAYIAQLKAGGSPSHSVVLLAYRPAAHGHLLATFSNGVTVDAPPCRWEDSENCYWNAHKRGNGLGTSFLRWYRHTYYLSRH